MSNQTTDRKDQEHNNKSNTELNDTHSSTSKTDKYIGFGENDENHTSTDAVKYSEEGKNAQSSTAGHDGKKVHTDNQGGTSSE